ncbi:MAG: zinc-ribbon and DUF3426 domain-containing protein [Gammaproteobacteria bacterium]
MYTRCPHCMRLFRVGAPQLRAAHGQVRCGYCYEPFNALESLQDEAEDSTVTEPSEEIIDDPTITSPKAGDDDSEVIRPEPSEAKPMPAPGAPSVSPLGVKATVPYHPNAEGAARKDEKPGEDEIPYVLRADISHIAHADNGAPRLAWGLAALFLTILFAGQFAWFNRDSLLQRFPTLRPWAQEACVMIRCELWTRRAPSAIKVLNRDVRVHPKYEKTLLVNATLVNEAKYNQPFPVVQLALFDTAGRTIAMGKFKPQAYLDTSIDLAAGMEPDTPVHIVLEVTGTTKGAVSFEFKFL